MLVDALKYILRVLSPVLSSYLVTHILSAVKGFTIIECPWTFFLSLSLPLSLALGLRRHKNDRFHFTALAPRRFVNLNLAIKLGLRSEISIWRNEISYRIFFFFFSLQSGREFHRRRAGNNRGGNLLRQTVHRQWTLLSRECLCRRRWRWVKLIWPISWKIFYSFSHINLLNLTSRRRS